MKVSEKRGPKVEQAMKPEGRFAVAITMLCRYCCNSSSLVMPMAAATSLGSKSKAD